MRRRLGARQVEQALDLANPLDLARLLNRRAGLVGGKRLVDVLREGGEEHVLAVVAEAGRG